MTTILIVPGLGGSGPEHWQTRWARLEAHAVRVEQQHWDEPECNAWCETLDCAVRNRDGDVVIVAHSLGAILVAHWAARAEESVLRRVKGALLVAPPDVESTDRVPQVIRHFAPIPRQALPFASIVVGSRDDTYACIDCPRALAEAWGAEFVDVGYRGHINADSNLGDWEEGLALLRRLRASVDGGAGRSAI